MVIEHVIKEGCVGDVLVGRVAEVVSFGLASWFRWKVASRVG